ncbi:MAG: hypothetical protein JWO80_3469 [Bryobacterales bacterium]|nr:hypothetical protein [Bryobacterales bacterium]
MLFQNSGEPPNGYGYLLSAVIVTPDIIIAEAAGLPSRSVHANEK